MGQWIPAPIRYLLLHVNLYSQTSKWLYFLCILIQGPGECINFEATPTKASASEDKVSSSECKEAAEESKSGKSDTLREDKSKESLPEKVHMPNNVEVCIVREM